MKDQQSSSAAEINRELAEAELAASRRIELGAHHWVLIAAVLAWMIYLVAPVVGSQVRGFDIAFYTEAARAAEITIAEFLFAWMATLGLGVFTTLTLITRRTVFALISWMFVTVALFSSLFSLWLRQTRSTTDDGQSMTLVMGIAIVGVLAAVISYSMVTLKRNPEHQRITEARANHTNLDEVGYAQREASQARSAEVNPLLVDDRRQRASARHRSAEDN